MRDLTLQFVCDYAFEAPVGARLEHACSRCDKHVQDLSARTLAEAEALMATEPAAGYCLRYNVDLDGNVIFRDARAPLAKGVRKLPVFAAAAASALAAAACGDPTRPGDAPTTPVSAEARAAVTAAPTVVETTEAPVATATATATAQPVASAACDPTRDPKTGKPLPTKGQVAAAGGKPLDIPMGGF